MQCLIQVKIFYYVRMEKAIVGIMKWYRNGVIIKTYNTILIIIMEILIQYLELITHVKLTLISAKCAKSQ